MANRFMTFDSADMAAHQKYRINDLAWRVRELVAMERADEAAGLARLLYRASGAREQWAYWFDKDMRQEML